MATTVNVSTWSELVDAIQADYGSETQVNINITTDIDCNYEIPLGVETSIPPGSSQSRYMIISGAYVEDGVTKNHIIRNLRTHITNPVPIFMGPTGTASSSELPRFQWHNVDFINLVLDEAFYTQDGNSYYGYLGFYNCRFVGRRTVYFFYHIDGYDYLQVDLNSCFFNVQYIPSSSSANSSRNALINTANNTYIQAYFCWFRETYNGWTVYTGSGYTNVASTYRAYMVGCYSDGELVSAGTSGFSVTDRNNYSSTIQNVIDIDFKLIDRDISDTRTFSIYVPAGIYKNYYTKYGDDSVVYDNQYAIKNGDYAIPESPSDMKNPAKLYADGFNIIVPT